VFQNLNPLHNFYKADQSWNSMCNAKHTLLEEIKALSPKTKHTNGRTKLSSSKNMFKNECSRSRIITIITIIIINNIIINYFVVSYIVVHWFIVLIYCDCKGGVSDMCGVRGELKRIETQPQNYGGGCRGGDVVWWGNSRGRKTILHYNMLLARPQFWEDPSLQRRSQCWILSNTVIKLRRNNREDCHVIICINFIIKALHSF